MQAAVPPAAHFDHAVSIFPLLDGAASLADVRAAIDGTAE